MTSVFGLTLLRQTNTPDAEGNNDTSAGPLCLTLLLFVGYYLTSVDKCQEYAHGWWAIHGLAHQF
jgi:hypothetical protein